MFSHTDNKPDSPSIITLRASLWVAQISATRRMAPRATPSAIHSAPARVLPLPRPPMKSQMRQSPSGGNCERRAQKRQSRVRKSASPSLRFVRNACRMFGGRELIEAGFKDGTLVIVCFRHLVFAHCIAFLLDPREAAERAFHRGKRARVLRAFGRIFGNLCVLDLI